MSSNGKLEIRVRVVDAEPVRMFFEELVALIAWLDEQIDGDLSEDAMQLAYEISERLVRATNRLEHRASKAVDDGAYRLVGG